ncbi:MAG: hypothetical protein IT560_02150 [Alphaproteobacteria bacterium]|nr:hypothetical protein [Alphaproteobacteria bacterium]
MIRIFALALVFFSFAAAQNAFAQKTDTATTATSTTATTAEAPKPDTLIAIAQENGKRGDVFYLALNAAAEKGTDEVRTTLDYGLQNGGMNEAAVAVQWLVDHTFGLTDKTKFNAFYFLFLSDLQQRQAQTAQALGKMSDYNKAGAMALKALMHYEIVALADAERCDDSSVAVSVMTDLLSRYDALRYAYKIFTKEEYDLAGFDAIEAESSNSNRPVNLALCRSGDKGKADPNYTPKAVEDWSGKRNYLRIQYKNTWSDQFYKMREQKKP